jgi:hypothetical protein
MRLTFVLQPQERARAKPIATLGKSHHAFPHSALEHDPIKLNRTMLQELLSGRIFLRRTAIHFPGKC